MKNETVSILGAGFHCIDIIHTGNMTKTALGGTAANVTAILAALGQRTSFLCPDYSDDWGCWLKQELLNKHINALLFSKTKTPAPRIIENLELKSGQHSFKTICPVCGKELSRCILPDKNHINSRVETIAKEVDAFFFDRISPGIKEIVKQHYCNWIVFEPNTCRNYQQFLNMAKLSDIVKFSANRIHPAYVKRLRQDLQGSKTCLIISTMASDGFCYSYRGKDGLLSDWGKIKSIKVDSEVDNTGAGDWFTAILLLLFLREYHDSRIKAIDPDFLLEILDTAKEISALKCGFLGVHGIFKDNNTVKSISSMLNVRILDFLENPLDWGNGCCACGI